MGSGGPEVVAPEQLLDLMGPHIDSFDYFVNRGLQSAVQNMQSVEVVHPVSNVNLRNILLMRLNCHACIHSLIHQPVSYILYLINVDSATEIYNLNFLSSSNCEWPLSVDQLCKSTVWIFDFFQTCTRTNVLVLFCRGFSQHAPFSFRCRRSAMISCYAFGGQWRFTKLNFQTICPLENMRIWISGIPWLSSLWLDKPVVNRPMKDQKDGALSLDQRLLPTEVRFYRSWHPWCLSALCGVWLCVNRQPPMCLTVYRVIKTAGIYSVTGPCGFSPGMAKQRYFGESSVFCIDSQGLGMFCFDLWMIFSSYF